jgi:hypothetical protein
MKLILLALAIGEAQNTRQQLLELLEQNQIIYLHYQEKIIIYLLETL